MLTFIRTGARIHTWMSWFCLLVTTQVLDPVYLTAESRILHPAWKAGDSVVLEIQRTTEDARMPGGGNSITDFAFLHVLDASPFGSRIEWRKAAGRNSQPGERKEGGIRLEANLDEKGHCVSIRNQPEATPSDTVSFALEEVMPYVHTGVLAAWRMPRPKDVVNTAIAEMARYLAFEGLELSGQPYQYQQPYTRLTGLHTLTGTLEGSVSKAGPVQVESAVTLRYDDGVFREALTEALERLPFASRSGSAADASSLTLVEKAEMKARVEYGIPDELTWTVQISDSRGTTTERFRFELVSRSMGSQR